MNGRWLIACEFSQVVCAAFRKRGIEAFSCDLLPTKGNPDWHIQGDAVQVAYRQKWNGMIAHPPCTYLSNMSNCRINEAGRKEKRKTAFHFFILLTLLQNNGEAHEPQPQREHHEKRPALENRTCLKLYRVV